MRVGLSIIPLLLSLFPALYPPAHAVAGSLLFNGSNYLSATATSSKFDFGTGNFTIEWWQKFSNTTSGAAPRVFSFGCYPTQKFQASIEGGTLYIGINDSWALYPTLTNYINKWSHIAIVRNGGTITIYQNGTSIQSATYTTAINVSTSNLAIGSENTGCTYRSSTNFGGLLSKVRMVKSAVYTTAFTPSTTYGLIANTIFMLDADTAAPLSDTGNTGAAVSFNNIGTTGVASNSEVPALPKLSQTALSVVQTTVAYKDNLTLTTSGGSTAGSTTFSLVSGPCTLSGSTLTPTGAGTCVVNATMAGDSSYDPVTSANRSITVTAKALTISGITIPDKNYNETTTATIAGTPTLVGVIAGDTVTLNTSAARAVFANSAVGNSKSVTVSGYSISGASAGGYSLTQPSGFTASILKGAPVIVSTAPEVSAYRSATPLDFSSNSIPGRVTFFLGKVRVPGCINIAVSAANSYSIRCNWKPSRSGQLAPIAVFTPTDSNYATITQQFPTTSVSRRTNRR